jgi:zinc protease
VTPKSFRARDFRSVHAATLLRSGDEREPPFSRPDLAASRVNGPIGRLARREVILCPRHGRCIHRRMTRASVLRPVLLLALSTGCTLTTAPGPTANPLVGSSVVTGKLPNGFSYYVLRNADPQNTLSLRLLVKAGVAQEDDDQRGVAHFVEHLAFEDGRNFNNWSTETRLDRTQYRLVIPVDAAGGVRRAFALLHDIVLDTSIDPTEVAQEQHVLLRELRASVDAEKRRERAKLALALAGSRYAEHLSPASPEDIAHATRNTLRRFHLDWYRPDTLALVAVGPVDPKSLVKDIERTFGDLESPSRERPLTHPDIPLSNDLLVSVVTDPDLTDTTLEVYSRFEAAMDGRAQLRASMLQGLLVGFMAVRLTAWRAQFPAFLTGQTSFETITGGVQLVRYNATVGDGEIEPCVRALFAERARARNYGFSEQELSDVKRQLLGNPRRPFAAHSLLDSETLADSLAEEFLTGIPHLERAQLLAWGPALLSAITIADVNEWALEHAGPPGTMLLISAPPSVKVPTEAELRTWVREASLGAAQPTTEWPSTSTSMSESSPRTR